VHTPTRHTDISRPRGAGPAVRSSRVGAPAIALAAALAVAACGRSAALYDPSTAALSTQAPDSFLAEIRTSEGDVFVKIRRHWSPAGVDRVHHLMANGFYAGARIYRVVDGFYSAYQDRTPSQDSIRVLGNEYLRREYPQLDSIVGTRVVTRWR